MTLQKNSKLYNGVKDSVIQIAILIFLIKKGRNYAIQIQITRQQERRSRIGLNWRMTSCHETHEIELYLGLTPRPSDYSRDNTVL